MSSEFGLILFVFLLELANCQLETKFATDCLTPNNKIGFCIEIQECSKLLREVENNNKETFEFIRSSRCGPPNEDLSRPKVCCGPDINFLNQDSQEGAHAYTTTSPPALSPGFGVQTTPLLPTYIPPVTAPQISYNNTLPKKCGIQKIFLGNRIFGGIEADVGEFPWLARLLHFNKYNKTRLGCSGFLIHRRFVLTAAHCLVGKGLEHLGELNGIILGMHNDTKARICNRQDCTDPPLAVKALRPIIHAEYDSNTHVHDIALIPLDVKINFTDFIRAICLPESTTNAHILTISGWGRTETDSSSKTKLKVEIPRYNRTMCGERYKSLGLSISDRQICAGGETGHDSCAGDSGGPLMAMNDESRWYAEGIVSFGNSCGREDWPGVYTNIPSYYDWIVRTIKTVNRNFRTVPT